MTVLRCADVCAMELGPAPRKHAPPQAVYPQRLMGAWGGCRAPGQFRAGFSEQQFIILARGNPVSRKSGFSSSFLPGKSGFSSSFLPEKKSGAKEIRCRFIILARKDEPTPDYAPEDMLGLEESQGQGPPSTCLCLKGVTMRRLFTLEYWRDGDWYVGRLMEVPGVFSQGESLDELRENIQEAYELMVTQDRTAAPPFAERQDVELEV